MEFHMVWLSFIIMILNHQLILSAE
jgi:hypothetical protein